MPTSSKTYLVAPIVNARLLQDKLESYESTRKESVDGEAIELVTSVEDFEISKSEISGTLKFDRILTVPYRKGVHKIPQTVESGFVFDLRSKFRPVLIVLYHEQDEAVTTLNSILSQAGAETIARAAIPANKIRSYVEDNAVSMKYCSWRDLNIPHISKSALWGPDVGGAKQDFRRYDAHGKMNYVMVELAGSGWVIAISEEARVIFYTKLTEREVVDFLEEQVEPLIH